MLEVNNVGQFKNESELIIHSLQAEKLILGEKKSESNKYTISGLETYGTLLSHIWSNAKNDDPYAEIALIEVERRINNAFTKINHFHEITDNLLDRKMPGITLKINTCEKPCKVQLNESFFKTPHAKIAARLIGLYDLLIRKLTTCRDFGIDGINIKSRNSTVKESISNTYYKRTSYKATRVMRGVFTAPLLYKRVGVTRQDILKNTPKGQEATKKLGAVPLEILNYQQHSTYGPKPVAQNN